MATKIKKRKRERRKRPTAMFNCLVRTKSTIESAKESMAPAYTVYARFCQETTLHGLRHTVENSVHWFERLLWFILTVSAFAGAVYCALSQLSRYNKEPVVVSLQRDYRSFWTMFPAVTACFMDRLEPKKAKEAIEMNWNVTEETDPDRYEYYYGFLELVTDVSFRTNLQNFWKYQNDDTLKDIDLLQLVLSVHPTMLLKVMISDISKEVYWAPVMTEVGMCMTFNSHYAEYQFILQDAMWENDQLLRCHYHSGQCFVRIDAMNRAVRFFIHSPFEISTAISNPTGEVTPGEELIIDFKAIEIQASHSVKKLRPEQRRCRYPDEWISNSIKAYSFGLCQMHCRNRMAMMFCGCRPYFHVKGDGELCDAQGMACIGRNVEILINLPKNLAKCSCMPQCNELNYYSHTKKVFIRYTKEFQFNFVKNISLFVPNMNGSESDKGGTSTEAALRINMMPPKFRLHRDVIFTLEDLFASLGGTTALFVGASVLTVVETALFFVRHLVDYATFRWTVRRMHILD